MTLPPRLIAPAAFAAAAVLAVRFALSAVSFDEARKRLLPPLLEVVRSTGV